MIDAQLLDFPAETLPVMVTHRTFAGETVSKIRAQKFMHGVSIRNIKRAGINVPVLPKTIVDSGIPPKVGCLLRSQPNRSPAINAPPLVERLIGTPPR